MTEVKGAMSFPFYCCLRDCPRCGAKRNYDLSKPGSPAYKDKDIKLAPPRLSIACACGFIYFDATPKKFVCECDPVLFGYDDEEAYISHVVNFHHRDEMKERSKIAGIGSKLINFSSRPLPKDKW